MIKGNTKIDQEKRAHNETETDVQVSTAETETAADEHTHIM